MRTSLVSRALRAARAHLRRRRAIRRASALCRAGSHDGLDGFGFDKFKTQVLGFVDALRTDDSGVRFRYSASCRQPSLYASAYACMTYGLLGEARQMGAARRAAWVDYFDSFQSADDGLFYDPAVDNPTYRDADWWGARHLAVHMISAYTYLGAAPRYPFRFLRSHCDSSQIRQLLGAVDWTGEHATLGDIDNRIMNIGCLLQYQRDQWEDRDAAHAVEFLKQALMEALNPRTGMWCSLDSRDPEQRSRVVQFAYHLYPLFFYDRLYAFDHATVTDRVLQTQNRLGGFGVKLNSSACEDIDSIDILVRLHPYVDPARQARITAALSRAFWWVRANQMDDGGFVFRLGEPFVYGSPETSSQANQGALFPTWFRTLSLAYMVDTLRPDLLPAGQGFEIASCPGYTFRLGPAAPGRHQLPAAGDFWPKTAHNRVDATALPEPTGSAP
jgi:hypothetical protein